MTSSHAGLSDTQAVSRPLRTQIADDLEAAILMGDYEPGARLIERELVERFGASSIPVREALQDLEGRGLVVKLPNVGCRVVDMTVEDVKAVIEMRRVLEPAVAGWAAQRITAEWRERLKAQWQRMDEAAKRNDLVACFHEDLAFHRMVWRIADNPFALRALELSARPLFASGVVRGARSGQLNLKQESQKHKRLLEAILAGDAERASNTLQAIAIGFEGCLVENAAAKARGGRRGKKGSAK